MSKQMHPRPDFYRENWVSLNGEWQFAFAEDLVSGQNYGENMVFPRKINVPFAYQTEKSGIHDTSLHETVWYQKNFKIPEKMSGNRIYLHFGAVDYESRVFLNGRFLGRHTGGYTPFSFEITERIEPDNTLVVCAIDKADTAQPRGKQYWREKGDRCWYTATTGIWQSVWLEAVVSCPIQEVLLVPDIDANIVTAAIRVDEYQKGDCVSLFIRYHEKTVKEVTASLDGIHTEVSISLRSEDAIDEVHYWTPEHPNLYPVSVRLIRDGQLMDQVQTYFGMRKISINNGVILLNNSPYYLKMVLDQGYWRSSGLTPPDEDACKRDILMAREMGFNGIRKHQKIEDPHFYYWADKLGILVWGELPSAYEFCTREIERLMADLTEFIKRDRNHPCIVAWVPLNESWGVRKILTDKRQQNFGKALYYLTKALDPTRLISTNDGWENVKTDIVGIHDYVKTGADFGIKYSADKLSHPERIYAGTRRLFAEGEQYEPGENALMITEYGGIALADDVRDSESWGYEQPETSRADLLERYRQVTAAIRNLNHIAGYCYTQLTDVYQEVNGLLTMEHMPKFDCQRIKEINE